MLHMHSIPIFIIGTLVLIILGAMLNEESTKDDLPVKVLALLLLGALGAYLMIHGAMPE